jgi:FHS family L-fucose permease-like MFS transporter
MSKRLLASPAMILIVMLFFLWGVANNLNDILIPQFRKVFTLNDLQSGLVQFAFYLGYFLLALPASLVMRRFGYKAAVVAGLLLYGLGALLFWPAAQLREYGFFLGALFIIASGLAFLETSANPLMTVLGPPEGAAQRINFAQAFNPAGSITGIFLGQQLILSGHEPTPAELAAMTPQALETFRITEAHAVQVPYLLVALFVLFWAFLVAITPFPEVATEHREAETPESGELRQLLGRSQFLFGVVAQFFYVGGQVCIWSFMIRYAQVEVPGLGEKAAAGFLIGALCGLFVGRAAGAALMSRINPALMLALFTCANLALLVVAIGIGGKAGLYALAITGFFMSISFPTIFALGVKGLGPLTKTASSFIVMSIVGGAVLPLILGRVSDHSSIRFAMIVPWLCFAVVALFAFYAWRNERRA